LAFIKTGLKPNSARIKNIVYIKKRNKTDSGWNWKRIFWKPIMEQFHDWQRFS